MHRALAFVATFLLCAICGAQSLLAERPIVPANRWALVIGASAYPEEIGALKYASSEARDFAGELRNRLGFDSENMRVLTDGTTAQEAPTSKNIFAALDSLLNNPRLDKANLFVFYFSGHGVGTPKGDFLLPSDIRKDQIETMGVPVRSVIERIVKAGLRNVLFIADACRAGTANDFGGQFIELCRQSNLAVILGCEPGKRSYEYPQLKSGAFTHFLIQSLASPDYRDESGTLWASKLGQAVQKQVYDYTEPDHGKFAQTPALWAQQSTLDVMLASYPKSPVSDIAIQVFRKSAEKLDKGDFAIAMTGYAIELLHGNRDDQAVELLKSVDQLGELTPAGQLCLGIALGKIGRPGEASRILERLYSGKPSYSGDLALLFSISRSVAPGRRIEAASRIFATSDNWGDKLLAMNLVRGCGSYEQRVKFAHAFVAIPTLSERESIYAKAVLAEIEGRWKDAITGFERALRIPGVLPPTQQVFEDLLNPIVALDDPKARNAWIERGMKIPGCEIMSYLQRAEVAKENGDVQGRVNALRRMLKREPDPNDLWKAALVAGALIGPLKTDFVVAAQKYPYAWRARRLIEIIRELDGDAKAIDELNLAHLYQEDPLTYNSEWFELFENMIEEAQMLGLDREQGRDQIGDHFLQLLAMSDRFGYDAGLWGKLEKYGLINERTTQLRVALSKYLPFKPESMPTALRPLMLTTALNVGDNDTVERLSRVRYEPTEKDDPAWFHAAYLASRGREVVALTMTRFLRPSSENMLPRMEAMKTYLLAKTGRTKEARTRLKTAVNDLIVRAYNGLAWAALGDWKKAEPLLAEQAKSRNWAFLFVSAHAMRVLDQHFRATGRLAGSRDIAYSAAASQPANPLFATFSFAPKPGIAQFAGKVKMDCVIEDDVLCMKSMSESGKKTFGFGTLTWTTSSTGDLSGSFTDTLGATYPFTGKLDNIGNFRGQANLKGRKFQIAAKLAPPALYKTYPQFKTLGQMFEFVDESGFRVALMGHTP